LAPVAAPTMVVELAPAGRVPADLTDNPELPDRFPLAQADPTGDPVRVAVARPIIVVPAVNDNVITHRRSGASRSLDRSCPQDGRRRGPRIILTTAAVSSRGIWIDGSVDYREAFVLSDTAAGMPSQTKAHNIPMAVSMSGDAAAVTSSGFGGRNMWARSPRA
jgi:hypothetical protein